MNRQLRADGGIMQVAPREKFGLGSKLKKFVRKIIPNEVADIAVKAAPFVAPFNPAVAAAMSGLGTFDQTGSIGQSLKGAGMNYAGGQAARYLGGAGFQGNPFGDGGAFTGSGFTSGFSSPLGSDTGLGKFFSNRGTEGVQGIDMATGGADGVGVIQDAPTKALASELSYVPEASIDMVTGGADGVGIIQDSFINKTTVAKEPGFLKNLFDGVSNQDYGKITNTIKDGAKKFGKAMFTNKDGSIDKAAVMGAITFATSYAEALALANDAGIELTEEDYNQAQADEKKAEYAGYLTNFFGGKKDGGRIGFESGANEMIKEKIAELEFLTNKLMEEQGIQDRGYASKLATDIIRMKNENIDPDRLKFLNNESSLFALPRDIRPEDEYYDTLTALENRANGGRIGFESGANEMIKTQLLEEIMPNTDTTTEDYVMIMTEDGPKMVLRSQLPSESMMMDTTTSVFGDAGRGRRLPEEFRADGGRIGFKRGSPEETSEIGIMSIDVESGDDEDEEDMMMAYSDAIFNRPEKAALFRALGDPKIRQTTKSFKNLNNILKNPGMFPEDELVLKQYLKLKGFKDGGRIGLKGGANRVSELLILRDEKIGKGEDVSDIEAEIFQLTGKTFRSVGGISDVPTGKMRKNNAGVTERDYRDEGGFVPVGIKERADDVPAMLSKK